MYTLSIHTANGFIMIIRRGTYDEVYPQFVALVNALPASITIEICIGELVFPLYRSQGAYSE